MKTRNGFVSNSSSSSFIATYGMIVDLDKFDKWKETCKHFSKYEIMTGAQLTKFEEEVGSWGGPICAGFMDYSLDEGKVRDIAKANPEATFVFKTGIGLDGDHEFIPEGCEDDDDWWGDLDYDIDLDRFDDEDIELFESSEEYNGINVIEQTYYAGRNG